MERYWVSNSVLLNLSDHLGEALPSDKFTPMVKAADAQATIAALQARVQELEEWKQIVIGADSRQDLIYQLSDQLIQRTAELEAANKHCEIIEERKAEAYKEVEIQLLAKANLQAELERVRGELEEAKRESNVYYRKAIEFEHELYGDPGHGMGIVHIAQELKKQRDTLRTLIVSLPKVEGEITVSHGYVKDSTRCHALFGADEDAALYAALLQHRQGMEG